MKFSFETPIKYQSILDDSQDYLFVLGHMLLKDYNYFKYVKDSTKYKILDNSAYELGESISPQILKNLATTIGADVIVIPDKLFDKERSEELANEFYKLFDEFERKCFKFMKVVTGNNLYEYLQSFVESENNKEADIIGISRARTIITPNLSYLMHIYFDEEMTKPIHMLGLTHPFELFEARLFDNIIKTVDTGLPINFAIHNQHLIVEDNADNFQRVSGVDLNSNATMNIELAKQNIIELKKYYGTSN